MAAGRLATVTMAARAHWLPRQRETTTPRLFSGFIQRFRVTKEEAEMLAFVAINKQIEGSTRDPASREVRK